ncbi:odorant receptor 13a-like isoform X1 [Microplitis mediator]|uniref:odorant receptor 13a-like isoform X1 n=2 Tax=Microplitis mediator TaxID=375433 RepID=UPI0025549662|nr:odorant receptor 13a-like isoform X1 [Microplitis mediator]
MTRLPEQDVDSHFAVKTTRFFMRMIGMWHVEKYRDKVIGNIGLAVFTLIMITVGIIQCMEVYYRLDDLAELTTTMPLAAVGMTELFKFTGFLIRRNEIIQLNAYTENKFWKIKYNDRDIKVLNDCNRLIMSFYPIFIGIVYTIPTQYTLLPIREYILSNGTVRILPYRLYFGVDWMKNPLYTVAYIEEIFAGYGVSLCAMATTSFLFTINIYAAGQFRILQNQFTEFCSDITIFNNNFRLSEIHIKLKQLIGKHQLLLNYISRIENLYNYFLLLQSFGIVLAMCFGGFGVLMSLGKNVNLVVANALFVIGCAIQLYLFSLSCQVIIDESAAIQEAIYSANWYSIFHTLEGKKICRSLQIIMIRCLRPCKLTVGKFTPMSLQTFASVLKTSLSYFTVLRSSNQD